MLTAPRSSLVVTKTRRVIPWFAAVVLTALPTLWAAPALASAPPVGQITNEEVTTVTTTRDGRVAVALPLAKDGLSWRLARDVDPKVLQQVSEGKLGNDVVIVFSATGPGTVRVVFAQTLGDSAKVSRAVTHVVTVR